MPRRESDSLSVVAWLAWFLGGPLIFKSALRDFVPAWEACKCYLRNGLQHLTTIIYWPMHIGGTTIAIWSPSHLQAVWRKWSDRESNKASSRNRYSSFEL